MILQIPTEISKTFIEEWKIPGAIILLLIIALGFLVRYIRSQNKLERDRLIKDKEEISQKNEILYTELKVIQSDQVEKYVEMKIKDHEIQYKMVEALKDGTNATNNMTIAFNKLMTKL